MKFLALTILLALAAPFSVRAQASVQADAPSAQTPVERKVAAASDVTVTLCLGAGNVVVRGWDRQEVQARTTQASRIDLRPSRGAQTQKGVDVFVANDAEGYREGCDSTSDVELDVPRGASVHVKVREGDVDATGVAELRVDSLNGDVDARRITRATEVSCLSGDVSLSDSKGRARLRSVSGSVDVMNVAPSVATDDLVALSTSGDVTLDGVGHASVRGTTTSGNVRMTGALASGGAYDLATHSGDVTLQLPEDASFRVNARVVFSGEIITDFPLTASLKPATAATPPTPPSGVEPPDPPTGPAPGPSHGPGKVKVKVKTKPPHVPQQMTLVGTVGRGDADLKLTSFSGTVYLKKE